MSHGSASAHSHRYSLHLFLKMETSTGLSCLCTRHALWRLWQGLNAWLCALSRGLPRGELSFCLSWMMSANGPTRKRRPSAGGSAYSDVLCQAPRARLERSPRQREVDQVMDRAEERAGPA